MKKKVLLKSCEELWYVPDGTQLWSDTYIEMKDGRKKMYFGPTMCSRFDLQRSLDFCAEHGCHIDKEDGLCYICDWERKHLPLVDAAPGGIYICPTETPGKNLETVLTTDEILTRPVIEKMCRAYLAYKGYDPDNLKFKWWREKDRDSWITNA